MDYCRQQSRARSWKIVVQWLLIGFHEAGLPHADQLRCATQVDRQTINDLAIDVRQRGDAIVIDQAKDAEQSSNDSSASRLRHCDSLCERKAGLVLPISFHRDVDQRALAAGEDFFNVVLRHDRPRVAVATLTGRLAK